MSERKQKKPLAQNGFKYRPQFGIIVICDDEEQQNRRYESLLKRGWRLKVVAV